jgi:hypothetical protein
MGTVVDETHYNHDEDGEGGDRGSGTDDELPS